MPDTTTKICVIFAGTHETGEVWEVRIVQIKIVGVDGKGYPGVTRATVLPFRCASLKDAEALAGRICAALQELSFETVAPNF